MVIWDDIVIVHIVNQLVSITLYTRACKNICLGAFRPTFEHKTQACTKVASVARSLSSTCFSISRLVER